MPQFNEAAKTEREAILRLHGARQSQKNISRILGRSRKTVQTFLRDPWKTQRKKRGCVPGKLTSFSERILLRAASKRYLTARQVNNEPELDVDVFACVMHYRLRTKCAKRKLKKLHSWQPFTVTAFYNTLVPISTGSRLNRIESSGPKRNGSVSTYQMDEITTRTTFVGMKECFWRDVLDEVE